MPKLIECVNKFKMGKDVVPADWGIHNLFHMINEREYNAVCDFYEALIEKLSKIKTHGGITPVKNLSEMKQHIKRTACQ